MSNNLYKNNKNKMVFGVCSGIADWLGMDTSLVRVAMLAGVFFSLSVVFWIYLGLGILLPTNPNE